MNKKHKLEIEELKAAHVLAIEKWKLNIENMIYRNFEDEMEEFSESFFTLSCDDFDGPLSRR